MGTGLPPITWHLERDAGAVASVEPYRRAQLEAFVPAAIAFVSGPEVIAPTIPSELTRLVEVRIADALQGHGSSSGGLTPIQIRARDFLTAFARDLVARRAAAAG